MSLPNVRPSPWQSRLDNLEPRAVVLVVLGVLLPVLVFLQPGQPVRALAAASLMLFLPGAAAASLLRLADLSLFLAVSVSVSPALTVLVSSALMYADIWSWQLTLALLGAATAVLAGASGVARVAP